jgi:septal ring factor EnvC (AmiA/AmiB activator)
MKVDLSKVSAALKSRTKRTHQNVPRVPKELHELKRETQKLEAQVKELTAQAAELKRQTAELRASRPVSAVKPSPALRQPTTEVEEVSLVRTPRGAIPKHLRDNKK